MAIVAKDDTLQIERLELGPFGTNAYIVVCAKTGDSILIDTPAEAGTILERLEGTNPKYILLTHNHMDHLGALSELHASLKVPLAVQESDTGNLSVTPEMLLKDGDVLSVGELRIEVIHTPGHTPGGLCFKVGGYLLSGDTIFSGGPGKTGSPAALKQIIEAITEKIFTLPDDTEIYPGHGDSTVLGKEKENYGVFSSQPHSDDLCGDIVWISS
ncbi:MAG: MBL fold metallo-hydrolase [Dehalococcoidales bacterium]|jgi:glyoxylase-like metal-dependent hydrolase (beta-lactamase superfamily II)|nr:MBL fold metallo-hydrolase [Dehalococcoidales bacterium]MDP7524734.1 MBL fold metallo-hydrolase [Dehalococcoidales bacterium]|tara:strand:- start:113 stop:754 length:642 start_codon:yes stop_codon:yes gene_type:complete